MTPLRNLSTFFEGLGSMHPEGLTRDPTAEEVKADHNLDTSTLSRLALAQRWESDSEAAVLEQLGVGPDANPESRSRRVGALLRFALGGLLMILTFVFVLGGILEGRSALFGPYPILALLSLIALLVILGLFEGLQICVALLRFKNLEQFAGEFPRAVELHRLFRSESGTRRFLAGRQFFVVFVVFFIARITTFPQLRHIPFLGTPLPKELDLFWFAFFDLGLLGALLVLWVAQLAPQFGANRDPLAFLCLPGMGLALRSSFLIDDLGLTLPGLWFASRVQERRGILDSPLERFRLASEETGSAALLVRRRFQVQGPTLLVEAEKRVRLLWGDAEIYEDESISLDAEKISEASFGVHLIRRQSPFDVSGQIEVRDDQGPMACAFRVSPNPGLFEAQDVLVLESSAECEGITGHTIEIDRPTRLVHVVFESEAPAPLLDLIVQRSDPHWPDRIQESRLAFSKQGGQNVAEYFCVFPRPGEVLHFSWRSKSDSDQPCERPHHSPRWPGKSSLGICRSSPPDGR